MGQGRKDEEGRQAGLISSGRGITNENRDGNGEKRIIQNQHGRVRDERGLEETATEEGRAL